MKDLPVLRLALREEYCTVTLGIWGWTRGQIINEATNCREDDPRSRIKYTLGAIVKSVMECHDEM